MTLLFHTEMHELKRQKKDVWSMDFFSCYHVVTTATIFTHSTSCYPHSKFDC